VKFDVALANKILPRPTDKSARLLAREIQQATQHRTGNGTRSFRNQRNMTSSDATFGSSGTEHGTASVFASITDMSESLASPRIV